MTGGDCVGFGFKVLKESTIPEERVRFHHNGIHGGYLVGATDKSTIVVDSSARQVFRLREGESFVGPGAKATTWTRAEGSRALFGC